MTDKKGFPDSLEMELLNATADDYESLQTITSLLDAGEVPLPRVAEMTQHLRDLQGRGWVQCYRLDHAAGEFLPIDQFGDEEAENPLQMTGRSTLWWLITESGLRAHGEYFGVPSPRGINEGRAKHILEVVSKGEMSASLAIEKWPVEGNAPWSEPATKAHRILKRLASSEGAGSQDASEKRAELRSLEELAKELRP